ncbi:AraC family transcriptional regulator [Paenibacillus yanchengensis]|uniref:AraC family transcriptional regulator n=1 Tax=Paenibacillus yanchengensis TaxID=2035833 RepID=A0ABW4YFI7_9BACL
MRFDPTGHQAFSIGTRQDYNPTLYYHTHTQYEIYYFYGDKANYLINDRIYVLEPGDLILMHGMTLHKAHVEPDIAYKRTTIHFDPYYFTKFMQPAYANDLLAPFRKLHNLRLQLRGEQKEMVEQLIEQMETLFSQKTSYSLQRFQTYLIDLMIIINQQCEQPLQAIEQFPSTKEEHVQSIITYIEKNFREQFTLEDLQDELHLSKYYLAKTFKEITGTTIFYFLMQRRIYEAKLKLIDSQMPITDISYEVGFKHPSHFSRAFKQHTEKTAEQYRKENQRTIQPAKPLMAERAIYESNKKN